MTNCVHCGISIDTANPRTIFYTVKPSVYECGECHNADVNVGYDEEMKKPINTAEAFTIAVTAIVIIAIFWLML